MAGQGWVVKQGVLNTIVNRAPTHEPYSGHGQGADLKTDLNPVAETMVDPASNIGKLVAKVNAQPVTNGLTAEALVKEPISAISIGSFFCFCSLFKSFLPKKTTLNGWKTK